MKFNRIFVVAILCAVLSGCSVHNSSTCYEYTLDTEVICHYESTPETQKFDQVLVTNHEIENISTDDSVSDETCETEARICETESEPDESEFKGKVLLSDLDVPEAQEIIPETESIVECVEITVKEPLIVETVPEPMFLASASVSEDFESTENDWFDSSEACETTSVVETQSLESTWTKYYNDTQYSEYPVACEVWQIIRSWGWNEAVAAGIIGNMMTECGGLTLDLDWDLYDDTWMYYGLCMWSLYWAPETSGMSIEQQMTYLYNTIETNMNYFGGSLDEFLKITDPGYAALYFQWYYEVGVSSETRYSGALEAYEYFRME